MSLTEEQKRILHTVVRRYDPQVGAAYLDPVAVEQETGVGLESIAEAVDRLEKDGYLERVPEEDEMSSKEGWVVRPTDKGLMSAMGLG